MRSDTTGGDGVADLDVDLNELERLLAMATPGEWLSTDTPEGAWIVRFPNGHDNTTTDLWFGDMESNTGQDIGNANLVAALHNAAPALIAAARREQEARALIAALVEAGQYVFCCNSWPHDGRRPHAPTCAWGKARAWLAAQGAETDHAP